MMGDWIQVIEFFGDDRPSRVTVERFRKRRDLLAHDRFGFARIQSCREMTCPLGVRTSIRLRDKGPYSCACL